MQNYKVFINGDLIFFEQIANLKSVSYSCSEYQMLRAEDLDSIVDNIKNQNLNGQFCIVSKNATALFEKFTNHFDVLDAAGGLVVNKRNELLMIHRFGKWDFPKGHVELNEPISQAAIREVTEETGAQNLTITQKLDCSYHMYDNHGKMVIKRTHWYLMKTDYQEKLKPQLEEDILAAVWVPNYAIEEYIEKTYPALKEMVEELKKQNIF